MITLTYRGITYKTQIVAKQAREKQPVLELDTNQTTSKKRLDYFIYRGISYIKFPLD